MIKDPYKGAPEFINETIEPLIDPSDEYHMVHKRRFVRTIQVLLDQIPSGKLLELGTSNLLPIALKTLAPEVKVSVTDFDLSNSEIWEKDVKMGSNTKSCIAYSVDLEKTKLPVPDETFDYVICSEVIEHMEIDPMFMLSEVNRVTKPGGILILTTPNVASSHGITKMLMGLEPYFYMQYQKPGKYHRHNYEYSVHTLAKVIQAAGFDGSIWTEDTFEEPYMHVVDNLRASRFKIENIGDNIFVVAKKIGPVVDRYPKEIYV